MLDVWTDGVWKGCGIPPTSYGA